MYRLPGYSGLDVEYIVDGSEAFGDIRRSYGMFTNVKLILLMCRIRSDWGGRNDLVLFGDRE